MGCLNTPPPVKFHHAPTLPHTLVDVKPRTFPTDMTTADSKFKAVECLEDPITVAWMLWASSVGVPEDRWELMRTGGVRCSDCALVRSHAAHDKHIGGDGRCADPGPADGVCFGLDISLYARVS